MDRKEWLIGELAKATAKKDYDAIEYLATENMIKLQNQKILS